MIRLPDKLDSYRHIGIDNGTGNVGLAVCETRIPELTMFVDYAMTLDAGASAWRYDDIADTHSALYARLRVIEDFFPRFLDDWRPEAVSVESPFVSLNVKTYGILTEAMFQFRRALIDYDDRAHYYKYAPFCGKKAVESTNFKDKQSTRDAIVRLVNERKIILHPDIYLDDLGDDAIDSISIGYCHHLEVKTLITTSRGFPIVGRW